MIARRLGPALGVLKRSKVHLPARRTNGVGHLIEHATRPSGMSAPQVGIKVEMENLWFGHRLNVVRQTACGKRRFAGAG
jgi:hypothetical protein